MRRLKEKGAGALAALALGFCAGAASGAPATPDQIVRFNSAAAPGAPAALLQGWLIRPSGAGPFGAIVLLHTCLGPPANRVAIEQQIAEWGYVALFVDDFSTRKLKQTCTGEFSAGVADAFGALRYLAHLPYVDRARIAAVGYSQGGDTALKIAAPRFADPFAQEDASFRASAAYYPPCANEAADVLALPTLVLVGDKDNVTPAADCRKFADAQPDERVKLVVYRGALHGFDNPAFNSAKPVLGMALGYDEDAAWHAAEALHNFLDAQLER